MQMLGFGSDYKAFQHNLGVPCLDIRFTHDEVGIHNFSTIYSYHNDG